MRLTTGLKSHPLLYIQTTSLPARVHRLNRPWNAPPDVEQSDENARFEGAVVLCGIEFGDALAHTVTVEWPARALVAQALSDCGRSMHLYKSSPLRVEAALAHALYELEKEVRSRRSHEVRTVSRW